MLFYILVDNSKNRDSIYGVCKQYTLYTHSIQKRRLEYYAR